MFQRLAKDGREFEGKTLEHINEYADAGLRTLVLAYRELDEEEFLEFNKEYTEAKNLVSSDREEAVEEVAEKIERDLILLGATAVEDKLQNGVCFNTSKMLLIITIACYYVRHVFYSHVHSWSNEMTLVEICMIFRLNINFFVLNRSPTALTSLLRLELNYGF